MKLNRLTARTAATLTKPGRHADGGGLYLSISNDGRRRWTFLYQLSGKRRELGLGSAGRGGVSLADARTAAAGLRAKIAAGIDPLDEKRATEAARAAPKATTFGAFAEDFVTAQEASWKNAKHRQQWRNTLATYAASIWSKPLDQVDVEDILAILKPIWQAKPETASRVRGRIEAILDAARCVVSGHRREPGPVAGKSRCIASAGRRSSAVDIIRRCPSPMSRSSFSSSASTRPWPHGRLS